MLGVTQSFISKCERGERRLDIVEVRSWCRAMGVPLQELIDGFEVSCDASSADTSGE